MLKANQYPWLSNNESNDDDNNNQIEVIFPEGMITEVMSQSPPTKLIFSDTELNEIQQAKNQLIDYLAEFKRVDSTYKSMLTKNHNVVFVKTKGNPSEHPVTNEHLRKRIIQLQLECIRFSDYLNDRYSDLHKAHCFQEAEQEFQWLLQITTQILGPDKPQTVKIKLNLGVTYNGLYEYEKSKTLMEECLAQLLIYDQDNNGIKKTRAICHYILAQYYLSKDDAGEALFHIQQSEQFRMQYDAPADELDRIRFIRGKISYKNDHDQAKYHQLLSECYNFRSKNERYPSNLFPIIDQLYIIFLENKDQEAALVCLIEMLNIKKSLNRGRDIINIKLLILELMKYRLSDDELWMLIDEVEVNFEQLPLESESVSIAENYWQFARVRLVVILPPSWSFVRKRQFHNDTLRIITKAENHLNAAADKNDVEVIALGIATLKEKCSFLVKCFNDPINWMYFPGDQLHPEDQAEIAITQSNDDDDKYSMLNDSGELMKSAGSDDVLPQIMKGELIALSEFSSEVRHSLVAEVDRILTIAEFEQLAEEGTVNPWRLRTAQGGIQATFRDGNQLSGMITALSADADYTNQIPPIEIGIHNRRVYSFDTRRLIAHQKAKENNPAVIIRYKKIFGPHLQERVNTIFDLRPWNGLVTAERFGGKGSVTRPFIIPPLRPQLEPVVTRSFQPNPNARKDSDPNGFPLLEKQGQKIYSFFVQRSKQGITAAQDIITQAHAIRIEALK